MKNELKVKMMKLLQDTMESNKDLYTCCEDFTFIYAKLESDEFKEFCRGFYEATMECLKGECPEKMTVENVLLYSKAYDELYALFSRLQNNQL